MNKKGLTNSNKFPFKRKLIPHLHDLQEQVRGHGIVEEKRVSPILGGCSSPGPPASNHSFILLRLASVLAPGPAVEDDKVKI